MVKRVYLLSSESCGCSPGTGLILSRGFRNGILSFHRTCMYCVVILLAKPQTVNFKRNNDNIDHVFDRATTTSFAACALH